MYAQPFPDNFALSLGAQAHPLSLASTHFAITIYAKAVTMQNTIQSKNYNLQKQIGFYELLFLKIDMLFM